MKVKVKASLIALLMLTLLLAQEISSVFAADAKVLPPNTAPKPVNPGRVYFPECGHHLSEGFLFYWRANGRDELLGCPISEEVGTEDGKIVQYFKKGRLEYDPQLAGTDWAITPGTIMSEFLKKATVDELNNPAYKPIAAFKSTVDKAFFDVTQHSATGGFYKFWKEKGGIKAFGYPLSEEFPLPFNGQVYATQDFERVRLIYSPKDGVKVFEMGARMAEFNQVDINPVAKQDDIPNFNTWLWEHWVDVNLSRTVVTYMEGDVPMRSNRTTTGMRGFDTPVGTFYIVRRVYNERMRGGTIGAEDYYDLDNVLFTQYFTWEGHALHYAWWRSSFGGYGSHGCVNMDYESSEFGWYFLTLGSRVYNHY